MTEKAANTMVYIGLSKGHRLSTVNLFYALTGNFLDTMACLDLLNANVLQDNLIRALAAGVPLEQIEVMWYGLSSIDRARSFNKTCKRMPI